MDFSDLFWALVRHWAQPATEVLARLRVYGPGRFLVDLHWLGRPDAVPRP